jgi:endonuclease YncB( thermonuclease family)
MEESWVRRFTVTKVVDGDTLHGTVDFGWRHYGDEVIRLAGIDTPEIVGTQHREALLAKEFVAQWVIDHEQHTPPSSIRRVWPFLVQGYKTDSFGRFVEELECAGCHESLTRTLLEKGYALPWKA